ncbi:hypothetical protein AGMMS49940_08740 [Spirochaetia bacterium]|nr:hypothetical protein AGMMS49940_08740 [Spirochaetia bacterium]
MKSIKRPRLMYLTVTGLVCGIALALPSCVTTQGGQQAPVAQNESVPVAPSAKEIQQEQNANNVDTKPTRMTIRDWSNRSVGEDAVPNWLKPLTRGNSSVIRNEFGLGPNTASKVGLSVAQRPDRNEARVQAGLLFAAQTANSLKQYVVTAAAQSLDQRQMDIVEDITTATKINITGNRTVTDFWQEVEIEDVDNRSKRREYLWYTVYEMDMSTWSALVRKYVNDVIGAIPDRRVQTQMANSFGEIDAKSKREEVMSDEEFNLRIRLQEQAAKDAQAREIAKINSKTAQNQAAADVARTQVQAEADARFAAYKYGDAATAAAASTTAADFDWISALATSANVLY